MIAGHYLRGLFLRHFAGTLGALVLLLQALDLFDNAQAVLARPGALLNLPYHMLNRLPLLVAQAIPISVLLAAILGQMSLARHNELTALRAAGVPLLRLIRQTWPAVLGIAVLQFVLINRLAPGSERRLLIWEDPAQDPIWLRSGQEIVSAKSITPGGRSLSGVVIVERDPAGRTTARVQAHEARWSDTSGWTLHDGQRISFGEQSNSTEVFDRRHWPGGPAPPFVDFVRVPTPTMEIGHLWAIVRGALSGRDSQQSYAVELQRTLARPLALILLTLLALPAGHGITRQSRAGPLLALVMGFAFLVFEGFVAAIGRSGLLPPIIAAWVPLLIFALLALWIYLLLEA